MGRWLLRLASLATSILVVAGMAAVWGWQAFTGPGPLAEPTTVIIKRGAGLEAIQTFDGPLKNCRFAFRLFTRHQTDSSKAAMNTIEITGKKTHSRLPDERNLNTNEDRLEFRLPGLIYLQIT